MTDYSITELDLSNQRLRELPDDIHLYTNLIKLCCPHNQLTALPNNLPNSIQYLDCEYNKIKIWTKALRADCRSLRDLSKTCPILILQRYKLPENLPSSLKELY
jgi:Leucine-rich repeat (LRR) protein